MISSSSSGSISGEEVRAVAALLAVGKFLGIFRSAGSLGACRDAFVGVIGLVGVGAGNVIALGDAASILGVT